MRPVFVRVILDRKRALRTWQQDALVADGWLVFYVADRRRNMQTWLVKRINGVSHALHLDFGNSGGRTC